jgi:hypothetical protein
MPTPSYILPGSAQAFSNTPGNSSVAQQAFTAATRALVVGTAVRIPARGMRAGDRYWARFNIAKTGAGTATSTVDVATVARDATVVVGNATARVSFTKPAGTAVADEGVIEVIVNVRTVAATGVLAGEMTMIHNLASTGHAVIPVVAVSTIGAAFDNSDLGGGYIVTALTTGAADVVTTEVAEGAYTQTTTAA